MSFVHEHSGKDQGKPWLFYKGLLAKRPRCLDKLYEQAHANVHSFNHASIRERQPPLFVPEWNLKSINDGALPRHGMSNLWKMVKPENLLDEGIWRFV